MIMEQTGILRNRLRESHPVLYRHFERSWEIALDEWLHAFNVNFGSTNSYPHLRNVESHLDQVLLGFESLPNTAYTERLSQMEIYMLLSAVLFHDFGRTQDSIEEDGHGVERLLRENYAHLGIPSPEIARSLGRICAFHDPSEKESSAKLAKKLSVTVIDPFGEVREPFLSALLTLADHMDAAFTRTLPLYVAKDGEIDFVGLFRRSIRGVYVDPFARTVRTVLGSESDNVPARRCSVAPNKKRLDDWAFFLNVKDSNRERILNKWKQVFGDPERSSLSLNELEKLLQRVSKTVPDKQHKLAAQIKKWKHRQSTNLIVEFTPLYEFLALDLLYLNKAPRNKPQQGFLMPRKAPLAIVLGNMRENREALVRIQDPLAANGIYLAAWVVESKEHLYNRCGWETHEPIFDGHYLVRVAEGMWKLSGQVFGVSQFSYEDLATHIGEPNIEKVRRAVRRIAIVTEDLFKPKNNQSKNSPKSAAIRAGNTHWEWRVRRMESPCDYVPLKMIEREIKKLEPPDVEYGQASSNT
jgi:hypothetical protein